MLIYALLIFFTLFLSYHENKNNTSQFGVLITIFLLLIFVFRDFSVGSDTMQYIYKYIYADTDISEIDFEPGFAAYMAICKRLGLSPRLYIALSSALICIPTSFVIGKFSQNRSFTFFLYITIGIFAMHLTGLRQSLAISLLMIGLVIILTRLRKKIYQLGFLIIIIYMSSLIHYSSWVGLLYLVPVLFCFKKKRSIYILQIIPFIIIAGSGYVNSLYGSFLVDRYVEHFEDAHAINVVSYFVIPYLIFTFCSYLRLKSKNDDLIENVFYCSSFFYASLAAASLEIPMSTRFLYYFSIPTLIFITNNLFRLKTKERIPLLSLLTIICVVYFFVAQSGGILQIDNYRFFF